MKGGVWTKIEKGESENKHEMNEKIKRKRKSTSEAHEETIVTSE